MPGLPPERPRLLRRGEDERGIEKKSKLNLKGGSKEEPLNGHDGRGSVLATLAHARVTSTGGSMSSRGGQAGKTKGRQRKRRGGGRWSSWGAHLMTKKRRESARRKGGSKAKERGRCDSGMGEGEALRGGKKSTRSLVAMRVWRKRRGKGRGRAKRKVKISGASAASCSPTWKTSRKGRPLGGETGEQSWKERMRGKTVRHEEGDFFARSWITPNQTEE